MSNKIKKIINNPGIIVTKLMNTTIFNNYPDDKYLKLKYRLRTGEKLELQNPVTYNQKIQWLKLYDRNPMYTKLVDKYEVRSFIEEKIGKEYLIPLIGVYDKFEDINFDYLPKEFVLKTNHDSGGVVICKDKGNFDIAKARKKLNKSLKRNYYNVWREWPYKDVKPRIICEKYMVDESNTELKDYKIYCFEGEPKFIQVDYNRFTNHKRNLYDLNWGYIDAYIKYPTDRDTKIDKPKKLDEMLDLARKLSKNLKHVRIDFYSIDEQIYFGEITFYSEAGAAKIEPKSFENQLNEWLTI